MRLVYVVVPPPWVGKEQAGTFAGDVLTSAGCAVEFIGEWAGVWPHPTRLDPPVEKPKDPVNVFQEKEKWKEKGEP